MRLEMTLGENLILMESVRKYRERTATNQRLERSTDMALKDLFWAGRNRAARKLYRRLAKA